MDIEKNIAQIAEAIAAENAALKTPPADIVPLLRKVVNKFVILQDSRFAPKKDCIAIVEMDLDRGLDAPPYYISSAQFEMLWIEAQTWLTGTRKGCLVSPIELTEGVTYFYQNGYDAGRTIKGWPSFSAHYRIAKREFTLLHGIPGHGKSEFMDEILYRLALQDGSRFALFSPENFPHEVHIEKLLSKWSGKPFHQGHTERMNRMEVAEGLGWVNDHFLFIHPHEDELHLDAVLSLAEKAIDEYGVDGIVIDPWNEIEHNMPHEVSETRYIGQSLSRCRRFARMKNIYFWMIAHPAKIHKERDSKGVEKKEFRVPSPYDVSGSAHWYNKSDNCLCIYRHSDNTVTVHVQKIKFKMRGKPGTVDFTYDKISGRYSEAETQNTAEGFYGLE